MNRENVDAMTAPLSPGEAAKLILSQLADGRRAVSVVVTGSEEGLLGRRCLFADGKVHGSLGDPDLDRIAGGTAETIFGPERSEGTKEVAVPYGHTSARLYFELHAPGPKMVIVGAGHIAQPLCTVGSMIGFSVEVLDDRSDFADRARFPEANAVRVIDFRSPFDETPLDPTSHVILVTRGHSFDYECLIRILRMERPPGYVGMIGSRRRVRATHEQLISEGFSLDQIRSIRAPVGLDLGGQTPAEIAVSVAAEIIQLRSGGQGIPLSAKERIVDRFFTGDSSATRRQEGR